MFWKRLNRTYSRFLKMLVLLISALATITPGGIAAAATEYFVDASDGDNFNNGLSPGSAWRNISRVNSKPDFQPGDIVRLKRGGKWDETLIIPSSGMTFTDYPDPDNPQAPAPLFDGLTEVTTGDYQWIEATEWSADNSQGGMRRIWYLRNWYLNKPIALNTNFVNWGLVLQDNTGLRRVRQRSAICQYDSEGLPVVLPELNNLQDGEYSYSKGCPGHPYSSFYLRWDAGMPGPNGPRVFLNRAPQATDLPAGLATAIDTNGKNDLVIENLRIRGAAAAHGAPAILINDSANVNIRNNEIYFSKIAIAVFKDGTQRSANNCSITSNNVHDNLEAGIYIGGNSSNNTISHNHIHHNFNLGDRTGDLVSIGITGANDAVNRSNNVIEYNDVHDNGTYGVGIDHVIAVYQAANTAVRYNDIHDNQQGAFYFAFNSVDSKFYYNRIYGNRVKNGFHLKLQGTSNLAMYNNTVYGNHVEADCDMDDDGDCEDTYCLATRTAYPDSASCSAARGCERLDQCKPYGIAPYEAGSYRLFTVDGPAINARIENNIIARNTMFSNTTYPVYLAWLINTTARMDHNLYFENISTNAQGTIQPLWRLGSGSARSTLAEWQEEDQQDKNSKEINPFFIDIMNKDFHLQPNSWAVNHGLDVGLTRDIEEVPIAFQPDIGAHELPQADLSISISDSPDPVPQGGQVTYVITVTNNGPSRATGVMVTGTLSGCFFSAVASGNSASCTRVATASTAGTLTKTVSVNSVVFDPNSGNNSATATTTVNAL